MMKRMIGQLVVAGLLSGGAMFAAASPSSALPDNRCMDEQHYVQQVQWYEDWTFSYFVSLEAWQNADHFVNPLSGQETWAADVSGNIVMVNTYTDYVGRVNGAQY